MFYDYILPFLEWFALACILWVVLTYVFRHRNYFGIVSGRWHHLFPYQKFSTMEIYKAISKNLKSADIPTVSVGKAKHWQTDYFHAKREYLRVSRGNKMMLICASPFGTSFFISWWLGEPISFERDLVTRLPFIGPRIARRMYRKTYFEQDTDIMFSETVHNAILAVIDSISEEKGIRGLSELERKPISVSVGDTV